MPSSVEKQQSPNTASCTDQPDEEEVKEHARTAERKSSPKIQFAHFSVQEYLCLRHVANYKVESEEWGDSFLSCTCSAYLFFIGQNMDKSLIDDMIKNAHIRYVNSPRDKFIAERILNDFPLLEYISDH